MEEPGMAFNYLKLELEKQANNLGMPKEELMKSDRLIITHPGTYRWTSGYGFWGRNSIHIVSTDADGNVTGSVRAVLSEDHNSYYPSARIGYIVAQRMGSASGRQEKHRFEHSPSAISKGEKQPKTQNVV